MFTDGEIWREQKKFTLQVFKKFGVGKNIMQEKVKFYQLVQNCIFSDFI